MIQLTNEEKRVRDVLIERAKQNGRITYVELIAEANLSLSMNNPHHRGLLGEILGHISEYENESGRPLLSCITTLKSGGFSDGFYKLADDLQYGEWHKLKKDEFAKYELIRTYNYWQRHKE